MPWWGWVVVGAVLLGSELFVTADFYLVFLGIAALAVGLAALAGWPEVPWQQWALFAVLVAAGGMSLAWMLLLTVVVIAEKMLPRGRLLSAAIGIALIVLGSLVAGGAATMPWLS